MDRNMLSMDVWHSAAVIAVTAICTLLIRALPFLIFGGNRRVPDVVDYLGKVLPAAVMATLVVYCLRKVDFTAGNRGIPELISVALVAGLHLWKKNILLSVGFGTVCYMFLVQAVFV